MRNITPANEPQGEYIYYTDEYRDFHGMNRFMLMIITAAMIPWIFGGYVILGFNISGWAWVIPLIISGIIVLRNLNRITFPIILWIFWIVILLVYWFIGRGNPDALQSLFQMLSPLVIGCAASTFRSDNWQLDNVINWITRLSLIAWIILILRVPMIITGVLPGHGFMAAEMIGLLLLGAFYSTFYAIGSTRYIFYYLSMLAITLISLTRGPIVSMISCLPLTFAPVPIFKRMSLITIMLLSAVIIFNTDRVQERMFTSGSGELSDISLENPQFKTSGRSVMWDVLWYNAKKEPWLGNGWNYHRVVLPMYGLNTHAPHNDWLKLFHDMGILGVGLYLVTMIIQILYLIRVARRSSGAHQMLSYGAATAFIPYALIMFTDNVILYVQFFGNLHFAIIGIVCGTMHYDDNI